MCVENKKNERRVKVIKEGEGHYVLTSVQALHSQKNTWHSASDQNYSMTVKGEKNKQKKNYNHARIKLATPLHTRFYIYGLDAHKDTNDSQIKINI